VQRSIVSVLWNEEREMWNMGVLILQCSILVLPYNEPLLSLDTFNY
jgi:hypothetical protein